MLVGVTGGAGKVGRMVVSELLAASLDVSVRVLDRVGGQPYERVESFVGDILNPQDVARVFDGADVIVHLAAVHKHGIAPDDETLRTNVIGTFYVHDVARALGVRRVVSTSSESVLGWDYCDRLFSPAFLPIDETHPLHPQDSYGLSKAAAEMTARSFTEKCGLETVVIRPSWVLTPETSAQLRADGGLRPERFNLFSYVDGRDLAAAYRLAVFDRTPGHHVCFVAAPDTTVEEPLATLLPRLMPEIGDMASQLTAHRAAISTERVRSLLGWSARHSWRDEPLADVANG